MFQCILLCCAFISLQCIKFAKWQDTMNVHSIGRVPYDDSIQSVFTPGVPKIGSTFTTNVTEDECAPSTQGQVTRMHLFSCKSHPVCPATL